MEQAVKIKIPRTKKYIHGTWRGNKSWPVVDFVHGLSGHRDEHIFFNGGRFFAKHKIATFRFNQYDWHKNARNLQDCTLKTQAADLDTVVGYLRKNGAKKIFVVGHSYGGPTILFSKTKDFAGVIFWDAAYNLKTVFDGQPRRMSRGYLLPWGVEVFIGQKMFNESQTVSNEQLLARMQQINTPSKIICAGKGTLIAGGKKYFQAARQPKELTIIPAAGHNFNEDGAEEKLFTETLMWIKRFV